MRVAIVGAGLLGQTLASTLAGRDEWTIGVLGHDSIEVVDTESCKRALDGYDVAVNTVAFHRLADCERDQTLARLVNTEGARNVASVLPTVYVSTDYVFNDGGPHDECLPGEAPRSVYGQTKLAGELATLEAGGIVVRVAGLFGRYPSHKGPTFPEVVTSRLYDTMRLPNDQRFSPTYADDAATRIAKLALSLGQGEVEGIYHAANAGSTTWAEFAENVLEVTGWKRKIVPYRASDDLRPTNSVLRSTRLAPLRHWRLALEAWADWRKGDIEANRVSPLREEARR